jgi:hypothetical protein
MFQRRENVGEVGEVVLRPCLGLDGQAVGPLAACNRRPPFAIAAVEHQDGVARGKPQHIAEVVALVVLQRDRKPGSEWVVDVEPRTAVIEFRHS